MASLNTDRKCSYEEDILRDVQPSTEHEPPRESQFGSASYRDNEFTIKQVGHKYEQTKANPRLSVDNVDDEPGLSNDAHSQKSTLVPENVKSDFTHVTTIQDFGLGVGMDYVKTQIHDAKLGSHLPTCTSNRETVSAPLKAKSEHNVSSIQNGIGGSFQQSAPREDENLNDQFYYEKEISQFGSQQRFLSWDKLLAILHESRVERELDRVWGKEHNQDRPMLEDICHSDPKQSRRLIMAILGVIEKVELIGKFIEHQVFDSDLPLTQHIDNQQKRVPLFYRYGDSDALDKPIRFIHHDWKGSTLNSFCLEQWSYVIPFFDMREDRVNFYRMEDNRIILPFLEWDNQASGGYGTVWKARIHPAHHNYRFEDGNTHFAVKEIKAKDPEAFIKEVKALERFSGGRSGHPHIIRLLMAFQHTSQYYLVFPLAKGNLKDLWQTTEKNPTDRNDVLWLLKQCLGIAGGLSKVHKQEIWENQFLPVSGGVYKNRGRHGDIKPQNILAFYNGEVGHDRLVISDFGLTSFHSAQSISIVPPDKVGGISRTYRAPEYDLQSTISQAYDMWSFGCLLLEIISWFLLGLHDGPEAFSSLRSEDDIPTHGLPSYKEDKFFNLIDNRPVVKDSVKNWFDKLRRHPNCPPCITDFLDIIQDDLLSPIKEQRAKVAQLHEKLTKILQKSEQKENYCVFVNSTEVVTSARPLRNPSGESISESLQLRKVILDQRDLNRDKEKRASMPLLDLVVRQHDNSDTYKRDSTIVIPNTQDHSEETIKGSNLVVSSQTESRTPQARQHPRSLGSPRENPGFLRCTSDATSITIETSPTSAVESFHTKDTSPMLTTDNSREGSPDRGNMRATLVDAIGTKLPEAEGHPKPLVFPEFPNLDDDPSPVAPISNGSESLPLDESTSSQTHQHNPEPHRDYQTTSPLPTPTYPPVEKNEPQQAPPRKLVDIKRHWRNLKTLMRVKTTAADVT